MQPLALAHLVLVASWGGVVLAETVLEFAARDDAELRLVARLHHRIDLLVELPLLAGIVGTGVALAARLWPLPPLLAVKVTAASVAIAVNLYCAALVIARQRRAADSGALREATRRIRWAWVGVPPGVAAAVIGLGWFA